MGVTIPSPLSFNEDNPFYSQVPYIIKGRELCRVCTLVDGDLEDHFRILPIMAWVQA